MDQKQAILHELLQQHQEPFHLKTYISDKRSQSQTAPRTRAPTPTCAFLHVPSGTAALLIEAATRIQDRRRHPNTIRNLGRSLFGSFLKILKHRTKLQRNCDSEEIGISCRLCRDIDRFRDSESQFGSSSISPFRFSPLKSPPEFCSPPASPTRCVKQEEEIVEEQCSPVSVLEALYEDEGEHQTLVGEEDDSDYDYDVDRCYANIQRARQDLLERLERFEKLAALDDVDLEQKLLEEECQVELGVCKKQGLESRSIFLKESRMKKKKKNKIREEEKCKIVVGRSCCRPDSIDDVIMEMELQFKTELEETATQLELQIFQDLIEQCFCIV